MTLLKATMSCTAEKKSGSVKSSVNVKFFCQRQLFRPAARHFQRCRTEAAEQETTARAFCKPPKLTGCYKRLQKTTKYTNTELDNRLSPSFCAFALFLVSRFWKYKTPSRTNPRPFVACCQALPAVAAVASNWSSDLCASRKDLRNVRFALWAPRAQCEQAWLQSLIFDPSSPTIAKPIPSERRNQQTLPPKNIKYHPKTLNRFDINSTDVLKGQSFCEFWTPRIWSAASQCARLVSYGIHPGSTWMSQGKDTLTIDTCWP